MEPTLNSLSVDMASLKAEMDGVRADLKDIKLGIGAMMEIKERLSEFTVHHEMFRKETQTMWVKIDGQREDLKTLEEKVDLRERAVSEQVARWKGAVQAMGAIGALVMTMLGGLTMKLYTDINESIVNVRVLQQPIKP